MTVKIQLSKMLAQAIYDGYKSEGSSDLLLEWIAEELYAKILWDHIPVFQSVWSALTLGQYTRKKPFWVGDDDYAVWNEYPKGQNKRVIVSRSDNNTHLFIEEGIQFLSDCPLLYKLRIATVWPRETKISGMAWGDDRDIDRPSLNTYRKRNYHYGYYDIRDKGHVALLANKRVDHAASTARSIRHALWVLRLHDAALQEEFPVGKG